MNTTASSYDQIPYVSHAFPQTYPDRLATTARIFRLSPPDVAACRVLELGCASGGNVIPVAFNFPRSEIVGIDLSRLQVEEAKHAIHALGLHNIRIEQASIMEVDDSWGQFDYIICHGVFSWVEPEVQDRILSIAARNLSPDGVAYISYNTYPGWHMREMVRSMMRYHAEQFDQPQEQVNQARGLLTFLASASTGTGAYNQLLAGEAERLGRSPDAYVFHEHLERTNLPIYFHEFIDRADRAGLQYLSEAVLNEMLTSNFPASVAATLERISADLLHLEQYMDFVRNRQFRQTLLCHKAQRPTRTLDPDVMSGLKMSSPAESATPSPDLTPDVPVVFASGGRRAEVASTATKAALTMLIERWPCAVDFEELTDQAMQHAARFSPAASVDEVRDDMLQNLFGCVMHGLIELHTQPPPCTNQPSAMPTSHSVSRFQADHGRFVVNAHHVMHELDALSLEVLKLADGKHRQQDMVDVLCEWWDTGRLQLEEGGTPVTDPRTARALLTGRVERAVASLTRSALFVA